MMRSTGPRPLETQGGQINWAGNPVPDLVFQLTKTLAEDDVLAVSESQWIQIGRVIQEHCTSIGGSLKVLEHGPSLRAEGDR